jgi:hypothetical protein
MLVELDAGISLDGFVDRIRREPVPAVRMSHFAWLVARNHEVPSTRCVAASDPAPEIRAWASGQRLPLAGC